MARAICMVAIGVLVGPADAAAPSQAPPAPFETGQAPKGCPEAAGHLRCLRRCTPAKLIFLPCMAVGAKAMPACRDREVARCVEICRRKFC